METPKMINEDFEAARAILNAELTQLAMAGSDTARVREKLAKLGAREQAERDAEQAAALEARKALDLEAVRKASELASAAIYRLQDAGVPLSEHDVQQVTLLSRGVVLYDPEIASIESVRNSAFEEAQHCAGRLALLQERANALQGLRMTGQGTQRDLAEAATIERDIDTLRAAFATSEAKFSASQVPEELIQMRQRAMSEFSAHERQLAIRTLHENVRAAEEAFLDAVRALMAGTGSKSPVGVYKRSAEFDKFLRYGAL